MHKSLERHVLGQDRTPWLQSHTAESTRDGQCDHRARIERVWTEVWGSEINLYYPELYAGTTDLVGVYNGAPAIMDFKQHVN
jgi:hypothetical protein